MFSNWPNTEGQMASWTEYKHLSWAKECKEHVKPGGFEPFLWAVSKQGEKKQIK